MHFDVYFAVMIKQAILSAAIVLTAFSEDLFF
jgi:hypothetical protein